MAGSEIQSIVWDENSCVRILDQTRLPAREEYLECWDMHAIMDAIRRLSIRGAPAIGIAGALALVLESEKSDAADAGAFMAEIEKKANSIEQVRPTAVNLKWALDRLINKARNHAGDGVDPLKSIIKKEALRIYQADLEINRSIGEQGQAVLPRRATVMTICNTGSLATGGHGTALGVIRTGITTGKDLHVVVCETRPLLQGARLTCWELQKSGIPGTLITDSAAAYYMIKMGVDLIIIGADRIAANADTANKIGSYSLAVLARHHRIPFYIAAPISTFDFSLSSGSDIPIEERSREEVTFMGSLQTAPEETAVWNPAFDIVPAQLISGIITEKAVFQCPLKQQIQKIAETSHI